MHTTVLSGPIILPMLLVIHFLHMAKSNLGGIIRPWKHVSTCKKRKHHAIKVCRYQTAGEVQAPRYVIARLDRISQSIRVEFRADM